MVHFTSQQGSVCIFCGLACMVRSRNTLMFMLFVCADAYLPVLVLCFSFMCSTVGTRHSGMWYLKAEFFWELACDTLQDNLTSVHGSLKTLFLAEYSINIYF